MKANELRIGNFLKGYSGQLFEITIDDLMIIENGDSKASPIPLTEEWLLKLPSNLTYPKWIKYLHELQNWYYWNNEKKELELK